MNNNDTSHVKNLGDPDHGLEIREDVQERLRQSMERLSRGGRGLPDDEVAKRLGLNW